MLPKNIVANCKKPNASYAVEGLYKYHRKHHFNILWSSSFSLTKQCRVEPNVLVSNPCNGTYPNSQSKQLASCAVTIASDMQAHESQIDWHIIDHITCFSHSNTYVFIACHAINWYHASYSGSLFTWCRWYTDYWYICQSMIKVSTRSQQHPFSSN